MRQNVAAVIIRNEQILLAAYNDESGLHYNYPGGGVEAGESLFEALRREVREETGATVTEMGRLLLAWEYVPHRQNQKFGNIHKLCLIFECTIANDSAPLAPAQPDAHQIGVHWLPLTSLAQTPVLPNVSARLLDVLRNRAAGTHLITDF